MNQHKGKHGFTGDKGQGSAFGKKSGDHCGAGYPAGLKEITAPYNFVPLSNNIVFPSDLSGSLSQDIPFKEGLSGAITCKLQTQSPIYIRNGGKWDRKDMLNSEAAQSFFKVGEDCIIPGTSLKGIIRSVLEIATFGKISRTNDSRYSVRDLQNFPLYGQYLTEKVNGAYKPKAKAAWLIHDKDGEWFLQPCKFARVEQNDLIRYHPTSPDIKKKQTAMEKYDIWNAKGKSLDLDFDVAAMPKNGWQHSCGPLIYEKATKLRSGSRGTIVFTGQPTSNETSVALASLLPGLKFPYGKKRIEYKKGELIFKGLMQDHEKNKLFNLSDDASYRATINKLYDGCRNENKSRSKHLEFIFYESGENDPFRVPPAIKKDFKDIHSNNGQPNDEWDYWLKKLRKNEKAPVFYLLDEKTGKIASMGLSLMYKLPYACTIHDAIRHTNEKHFDQQPDFAEMIFGYVGLQQDNKTTALRGRVSVSHAIAEPSSVRPFPTFVETVLGAPKPTFYPNYIKQPDKHITEFRTLMDDGSKREDGTARPKCEISGWKRYHARRAEAVTKTEDMPKPPLDKDGKPNLDVATRFTPLEPKAEFTFTIHVHNLRPVELGALLWALALGGDEKLVHSIGMGKSLGYGQAIIKIADGMKLRYGNGKRCDTSQEQFMSLFEQYMTKKVNNWKMTDQIRQLTGMANPENQKLTAAEQKRKFQHLQLRNSAGENEFALAKGAHHNCKLCLERCPL